MRHEGRDVVGRRGGLGVESKVGVYAASKHVLDQRTRGHEVVSRNKDRRVVLFRRVRGCRAWRREGRFDGGLRCFLPLQ